MKKKDLYIFLDIDGVLNDSKVFEEQKENPVPKGYIQKDISPACLWNYRTALMEIQLYGYERNPHVILTSSWKIVPEKLKQLKDLFDLYEMPNIEDVTEDAGSDKDKGIRNYCNFHNIPKDEVLILDDEIDDNSLGYIIKTDFFNGGFNEDKMRQMIRMFDKYRSENTFVTYDYFN